MSTSEEHEKSIDLSMIELDSTNIIGLTAAALSSIKLIPQAIKALKTRSVEDLSLFTFSIWVASSFLYCVYGYRINSLPIMISNGSTLAFTVLVVLLKLCYHKKPDR
jgi:MtN3 and saliva related transmembrane protein